MPSTIEITSARLRALDPDLPMLAARAAMELDNFKSTGETAFTAVKDLSARLKNSFENGGSTSVPYKALLDSSTVTLVGRALNSSKWAGNVSTIDQLSSELWDVAQRLEQVEIAPAEQPIEKIRDFCVALSECAASYRQAFHDLRPSHPFRGSGVF
jgi:hypothetical protein